MSNEECIKNYLPSGFMPTDKDVVCARGKEAFMHTGNKRYRDIIEDNLDRYKVAGNKNKKSNIVIEIVEEVRTDAPAGFIRFCDNEQLWFEIGDEAAREKVGQTLRETLTQRDPEKRAKKRIMRAVNKAKRTAALKALDLEPLSATQCTGLSGMSRQPTVMPLPSATSRAWSAPQEETVLQNTAEALLAATAAPHSHYEVDHVGSSMDLEPLSVDLAPHFPSLQRRFSVGNRSTTVRPLPLSASQSAPANFRGFSRSNTDESLQQQDVGEDYSRPPYFRAETSKDHEALLMSACVPPTLTAMTSREWLSRMEDRGNSLKESDFERQLFGYCRAGGLSAAAC